MYSIIILMYYYTYCVPHSSGKVTQGSGVAGAGARLTVATAEDGLAGVGHAVGTAEDGLAGVQNTVGTAGTC